MISSRVTCRELDGGIRVRPRVKDRKETAADKEGIRICRKISGKWEELKRDSYA